MFRIFFIFFEILIIIKVIVHIVALRVYNNK